MFVWGEGGWDWRSGFQVAMRRIVLNPLDNPAPLPLRLCNHKTSSNPQPPPHTNPNREALGGKKTQIEQTMGLKSCFFQGKEGFCFQKCLFEGIVEYIEFWGGLLNQNVLLSWEMLNILILWNVLGRAWGPPPLFSSSPPTKIQNIQHFCKFQRI